MRIAVVGLGGVGGYIAASISKTKHEIVGFARTKHLDKIQRDGIKIVEDTREWQALINAIELSDADGYFDIVLFCVKSYDLKESYEAIANYIDTKSIIVSFSNGVSNGDTLRELSKAKVLDACVYILSHLEEAGVIRKKGKVFAAVFGGDRVATNTLKSIFDEANLRVKTPSNIKNAIWKKYIFISAFATLTSYYNSTVCDVYKNHFDEAKESLKEIASIAYALGINIDDEVQKSLDIAKDLPFDASTSMHLDFQNKKRNELESLSGYIVHEAKKRDIQVPQMLKMYERLLEL